MNGKRDHSLRKIKVDSEISRYVSCNDTYILILFLTIGNIRYATVNLLISNDHNFHLLTAFSIICLISCLHVQNSI